MIDKKLFNNNLSQSNRLINGMSALASRILNPDKCYGDFYFNSLMLCSVAVYFGQDAQFHVGSLPKQELLRINERYNYAWAVVNGVVFSCRELDGLVDIFVFSFGSEPAENTAV